MRLSCPGFVRALRSLVGLAVPLFLFLAVLIAAPAKAPPRLRLLFLGDQGHHRPADRFRDLQPVLAARGIDLTYTENADDLNPKTLAGYDGLIVYANIEKITPSQEQALLDYVAGGKGFIPIHCASYCFQNSPRIIELVGAQFQRHGTGVFRTEVVQPEHPVMKGFQSFESWDETYVHTKHNEKDRTVLEVRGSGGEREPWTWVRTHGKGRVFYTAWGHDQRTWNNPGFQNLIERGIRWAVGGDPAVVPPYRDQPEMTPLRTDVKPFEYTDADVPFYSPDVRGKVEKKRMKMQLPLEPQESMKHMVHPADFELQLFASEPQLGGKPISMSWDERGRLWVLVTLDYPNELKPKGEGRDRIVICEDTDGDGKADKFTVFADKLSIPTSLAFWRGGVVVHQAPDTLYLKDTNGDDVADERRVLFTGWGTRDTHAGPSNLHYGLDNWLWGIVGYSGFEGTIGGERFNFKQGFYRFRPDGSKFEFLRSTNNNSWGVGISEEGIVLGSTANGVPSVYLPIPNRYYESVRGWTSTVLNSIALDARFHPITDKIRKVDWHGQFTAGAGHNLYTARSYPKEYWNRTAFVSDGTGHLTATFLLQRNGSDFSSRYGWNLLASDDEWCAPVFADVGPDGQVWVIDWYNFIVQHNPTPPGFTTGKGAAYETPLRDKQHGRIYRLVYKHAKPEERFTLKDAMPEKLLSTLKHDNMFWRIHAQRLLVERGKLDVLPALVKLAGDGGVDAIGLNAGVVHALWTMHGLGALEGAHPEATAAAVAALRHASAGVRRNAVAVLPRSSESVRALLDSGVLEDADAQVRLAALLALADLPSDARAGSAIAAVLTRPENLSDRWIPEAATSAAAAHDLPFLKAVASAKGALDPRAAEVTAIVAQHYARGGPAASVSELVSLLATADPARAEIIVGGLAKGWPKSVSVQLSDATEKALSTLLTRVPPGAKGQLILLATTWGSKGFEKYAAEIVQSLLGALADEKQSDGQRLAAARQVIEFRAKDDNVVEKVLQVLSPRTSPQLTVGIIDALGASRAETVGPALTQRLGSWTPAARQAAVHVLLSRTDTTRALLDGAEKGQVNLTDLALDQKQALASYRDAKLAERARKLLERGGGLPNADRQKVVDQFMPLLARRGDADLGKVVFKNQCAKCHMHSGEGAKIGPDLTGMAVKPKDQLLVDILDPSRSVEGNFRVYQIATQDGRLLQGLLSSETRTAIELLDAEGKKQVVLRDNIEELTPSPKSLMPEGFEKQLTPDDFVNLLAFLTQHGKYLPLPLAKAATAVSTRGMFHSLDARQERLVFPDWGAKTVEGVPFQLVEPRGDRLPNVVLLNGPNGTIPPQMPRAVSVPCNVGAKAVHLLSGVSGWGFPGGEKGSVSMIVRLRYADGTTEDHALRNGVHFADYIRVVDVPESKLAFRLRGGQQVRYLAIHPKRTDKIDSIEFVKGQDQTAPLVVAVTVETAE